MTTTLIEAVAGTALTASSVTLYTVPALTTFTVAVLHCANVDSATRTIRACVVAPAGSPSAANAVLWDFPLAAADVLELLRGDVWPTGTTFRAWCDSSGGITLRLSGVAST